MNSVLKLLQSGEFDPMKIFAGEESNFLKVKAALEDVNKLPKEVIAKFLVSKIMPIIFTKEIDNCTRDKALECGFTMLKFVNVSVLDINEQKEVFNNIETLYCIVIGELRDSNYYTNWDKLWIFLMKFCDERLHYNTVLANKLLRVVERAFRNSTSEQRIKAYNCWTELINNSSLNMNHMCSTKQIKLLVTPMKAKFSKTPEVLVKRCETFIYLLEKLQDKATLCLNEFLEFCFGPFENNDEKTKQGRCVAEACSKGTEVLFEIIGHSHGDNERCVENKELHLFKPLINVSNFPSFADILIGSVFECYVLLKDWRGDSVNNNIVIKCLWRSLLHLIHNTDSEVKNKCCSQINTFLKKLLEKSQHNIYLKTVLSNLIDVLIHDELVDSFKDAIFDVFVDILQHPDVDSYPFNLENVHNFIISCFDPENGSKFDRIVCNLFKNYKRVEYSGLCDMWLKCKITTSADDIQSFMWPVIGLRNFKTIENLNTKWLNIYTNQSGNECFKIKTVQELERLFSENPLLSSNVVHFLGLIASAETNVSKEFVSKLMRLIELVLTLPNLSTSDVKAISAIILTYCNPNQNFYKTENTDDALNKLCSCVEHLLKIHKDYTIILNLANALKDCLPKHLAKFSKRLVPTLESLMLNGDQSVADDTRKLIELLYTTCVDSTKPSVLSRSMKIMNLASTPPKTNHLKLFGRSRSTSPLSLRPRRSATGSASKNKLDFAVEDRSSDYVKIDTEVKVDPENLNEHQKEMLKKRRDDIPALYEDLTQSQSQDLFAGSSETDGLRKKRKREENDEEPPKKFKLCDDVKVEDSKIPKTELDNNCQETPEQVEECIFKTEEGTDEDASKLNESLYETAEPILPTKEKSSRNSLKNVKKLRQKLVDSMRKEIEKNDEENSEKTESNALDKSEEIKSETVRKSKRQIKAKKRADYLKCVDDRRRSVETKENNIEAGQSKAKVKRNRDHSKKKKQREETPARSNVGEEEESFADLLDRIDRRIKDAKIKEQNENKEKTKAVEDNNKNKIISLTPQGIIEDNLKLKKTSSPLDDLKTKQSEPNNKPDVYEFKAECDREDLKIRKKANRLNTAFARSAYVSRRRRKNKRDNSKGYPFHVTADSVPLFKSQLLRTVPVSQKSETITIVITRSPPDSIKENKETPTLPSRRSKRKQSPNTDDVIESSQVTPVLETRKSKCRLLNMKPLLEPPNNKRLSEHSTTIKTAPVTVNLGRRFSLTETISQTWQTSKRQRSQSLDKVENLDTEVTLFSLRTKTNDESMCDTLTFLENSETQKDQDCDTLTLADNSETQKLQQANTLTLETQDNLPGSPIMCDTPDRTTELLNSTSDISPIHFEMNEMSTPVAKATPTEMSNLRSSRLVQMVNSNVNVGNEGTRWLGKRFSSPRTKRVRKMKLKKEEENVDILTFSREIPSPLTVPSCGILKRKFDIVDEAPTPSPKRKRVNFCDPAISEKKIFIRDSEEFCDAEQNPNEGPSISNDVNALLSLEQTENGVDDLDSEFHDEDLAFTTLLNKIQDLKDSLAVFKNCASSKKEANNRKLIGNKASESVTEEIILPLIEDSISLEQFIPKLLTVIDQQPRVKRQFLQNEICKSMNRKPVEEEEVESNGNKLNKLLKKHLSSMSTEQKNHYLVTLMEKEIDNISSLQMIDLTKKFVSNLEVKEKEDYLISLMHLSNAECGFSKKFGKCLASNLENFIKKMPD